MNPTTMSREAYQQQFAAQTDIFKEQIITKEFYPKAVSDEFQKAVQRRASLGKSQANNGNSDTFDPFAAPQQQQPPPTIPTFTPPVVQIPTIVQQQEILPPSSTNVMNNVAVGAVDQSQVESKKLITAMQKYLKSRIDIPSTVGELSAQIKTITGQSWGGFWEGKYGSLASFLKSHPEAFSVVKNKYVVVAGQEDLALRQLDKDAGISTVQTTISTNQDPFSNNVSLAQQPISQQSMYSSSSSNNNNNSSQFMQQQQQQQPQQYGYQFNNNNNNSFDPNFGMVGQYNSSTNVVPPPLPFFSPVATINHKSMFEQQPSTGMIDYNNFGTMPTVPPTIASHRDSSADWMALGTAGTFDPFNIPTANNNNDFMVGQQQQQFNSSWAIPSDVGGSDDWGFGSSNNNTNNSIFGDNSNFANGPDPLSNFSKDELEKQARKAAKKAEKKAQKEALKLAEEDEKLARKLQEEEYAKAGVKESEWITLSVSEMRDLAEKELGKDNVRIIAGFTVKKMGREGRPHQRKMWITASLTHLAWSSSLLDGSHRGVELRQVTDIVVGQMTHTISRNTSDKAKVRALCFSLVTSNRTLDLQACSVIQRDTLVAALQSAVDFNKKYRPVKVDRYHTKIQVPSGTTLPISIGSSNVSSPNGATTFGE